MIQANVHLAPILDDAFEGECVADRSHRLSYAEFRTAVHTTAAALEELGVRRGHIVATLLSNRVELVVTMFAAWTLGAGLTPVNPALTDEEVAYQLTDAGVTLVVAEPATRGKLNTGAVLDTDGLLERAPVTDRLWAQPEGHELALVVYTSGTTGRPKGVMLDHANLAAMTRMLGALVRPLDRSLLVLPLFHVNAIMVSVVAPLALGGSTVIEERFDAHSFWTTVANERPTYFSGVPAIYFFLTILSDEVEPDVSSLRFAVCGAAPMPASAIAAFEARYGIPIVEGYGLSESTVALTVNPVEGVRKPGTVGVPFDGVEIAIVDDAGQQLAGGQDGEVVARGPIVMRGYLGRPEETEAALRDGWLHTGDIGHLDEDGYLVLVDRKKDLIIRGGENISPSEVEAVLSAHPTVVEAAVVGRHHPLMGEEPVAFVLAAPNQKPDQQSLQRHCREVLASFKVPREIFIVDDLPRNAVGKVLKTSLRERLSN